MNVRLFPSSEGAGGSLGPSVLFSDNFNRGPAANFGAAWSVSGSNFTIRASNDAMLKTDGFSGDSLTNKVIAISQTVGGFYVQAKVTGWTGDGGTNGIFVRTSNPGTNTYILGVRRNGGTPDYSGPGTTGIAAVANDIIRLEVNAALNIITSLRNGSGLGFAALAGSTPLEVGLVWKSESTGPLWETYFDDFEVGTL